MAVRNKLFAMRVSEQEQEMLRILAEYIQRSQSDTVRFLVRNVIQEFGLDEKPEKADKQHA